MTITELLHQDVSKLAFIVATSFLIGLVHEERKADITHYVFGGVRTFPIIGRVGYTAALLTPAHPAIFPTAFAAVCIFMSMSYYYKTKLGHAPGITTETSALLTFLLGAVVFAELFWIAMALVVVTVLLIEFKMSLEGLTKRISEGEIITFTKFLVLAAVILPILPNQPLTPFQINPQKAWEVVVAISAISYISYILQKLTGAKGIIPSAILGGAYSSTATTIALSKRSVGQGQTRLFAGSILAASGVMYIRLAIIVSIFSSILRTQLAPIFAVLGVITIVVGVIWSRSEKGTNKMIHEVESRNPLELFSALLFAALFVGMMIITRLVLEYLGSSGVYILSIITGVTDVDPFILSLTQSAGSATPAITAICGVIIAAASNNVTKGVYAFLFADRPTGVQSLLLLIGLAVVGALPLIYFLV
jgi:uncharacterized membrane protein (DUF4010 family)